MLRSSLFWAGTALRLLFAKRHMVLQSARTDCGVASVLTVLNLLGRHADPVDAADRLLHHLHARARRYVVRSGRRELRSDAGWNARWRKARGPAG